MPIDTTKGIQIKGYPNYYVIEGKIWQIRHAHLDIEYGEREIVPNERGKIALKNEKGVPEIFLYDDVLEKIREVEEKIAKGEMERPKTPTLRDPNLDPILINKRINLRMKHHELLQKAKKAINYEQLQEWKPLVIQAEKDLLLFDAEHPEYNDDRRKLRPSVGVEDYFSESEMMEIETMKAKIAEAFEFMVSKDGICNEIKKEIKQKYGKV